MSAQHDGATLLFIIGSDRDDKIVRVAPGKTRIGCSTDIHYLLGKQVPFARLQVTRNHFRQKHRPELLHFDCVLNLITEAEENGRVLDNLRKILREVPGKVINRPEAVLQSTRDQVARRLTGIDGLIVPRAIRLRPAKPAIAAAVIERAGLKFPVILRRAGTHTGRIVGLFEELGALQAALEGGSEHIATEFVDFRSADGFYRKYRCFFFGQRRVLRHMLVSDDWNVHAKDRTRFMASRPELAEEESRLFERAEGAFTNEVDQVLTAVRELMPLDFFGIDFGIAPDGQVVLFEANATMNFLPISTDPQFAYLKHCVEPARLALVELLGIKDDPLALNASLSDREPAQ